MEEYIFDIDNEDLSHELTRSSELFRRLRNSKVYPLRGDHPDQHPDFNVDNVSDNTIVSLLQDINGQLEDMLTQIHSEAK